MNQYNLLCRDRLKRLKPDILKNLTDKQKKVYKETLTDFTKLTEICCIGQIFVTSVKPTIFDDINKPENVFSKDTYTSNDVEYELEDVFGKVKLRFINQPFIVTGQIIGIEGIVEGSIILVKNIIFPNEQVNKLLDTNESLAISKDNTVIFVSKINHASEFEYFIDSLKEMELDKLIIFGIDKNTNISKIREILKRIKKTQVVLIQETFTLINALPYERICLDLTVNSLQNPTILNNCLFIPQVVLIDMLKYHPNENLAYVERCLDVICLILKSKHCCPTAPDTVKCYPFENDPFIFETKINCVVVAGDSFIHARRGSVHFLSIPDFMKECKAVRLQNNVFKTIKYQIS
ncbi:DNA polymerase delta subunit 2 [Cucumispora dikerogammari]|nr:DNA polymerase delta subunit 2 [Cucumispora dikerogammari]